MAEDTTTSTAEDSVTTKDESQPEPTPKSDDASLPQQDGGVDGTGKFDDHEWGSDEEWQLLLRGLDFGVLNEDKKIRYIEKRKHKYFKEKIDPTHEIPKVQVKSRGSRYQAPPQSSTSDNDATTGDSTTNDDSSTTNATANDSTDTKSNENSESKPKPKPKPKASASASASASSSRGNSSNNRGAASQLNKMQELLNYFFVISQLFIFTNCVLSVIMPSSHYRALYGVIASHIVAVVQNTGRPQFNMYYAQRLFQDENVMIAIYGLMFLMGPPVFVFLIPVAMRSLHMGCYMLSALTSQKVPSIHSKLHPLLFKVTSKYYWFLQNIALSEVMVGVFLIPACFFISRTVILTLFYWQIMHARYMMSPPIKGAFTLVNLKLESLFGRVPAVLNIYRKIAQFLYDKVDPVKLQEQMQPQAGGGGGGLSGGIGSMMKKCSIM